MAEQLPMHITPEEAHNLFHEISVPRLQRIIDDQYKQYSSEKYVSHKRLQEMADIFCAYDFNDLVECLRIIKTQSNTSDIGEIPNILNENILTRTKISVVYHLLGEYDLIEYNKERIKEQAEEQAEEEARARK